MKLSTKDGIALQRTLRGMEIDRNVTVALRKWMRSDGPSVQYRAGVRDFSDLSFEWLVYGIWTMDDDDDDDDGAGGVAIQRDGFGIGFSFAVKALLFTVLHNGLPRFILYTCPHL